MKFYGSSQLKGQRLLVGGFIALFAALGVILLLSSHAASPFASIEAETGTIGGLATVHPDNKASGNNYLQFGGASLNSGGFLQACGLQLCLNGKPFIIHGATAYGMYSNPNAEITLAQQAKVNVLEMVEFDNIYHTLSDTESANTWNRADAFIAAAKASGLHIILNLSEYGQSLQAAGNSFTTTDWQNYLNFVANRTNSITGVQYKDDPTIAMVELFGEVPTPNGDGGGCGCTTTQMTSFFQRTLAEWHALAPNILVSTGGFSYLNDPGSGVDWKTIVNDPNNAACDMEINSLPDQNTTTPMLTAYCKQINKPWFLAAWSSCFGNPSQGYNYYSSDTAMATHAQAMYNITAGNSPASYAAIGTDFWNLQTGQGTTSGTCAISTSFPATLNTIAQTAPN